jgi:hypothetical protein
MLAVIVDSLFFRTKTLIRSNCAETLNCERQANPSFEPVPDDRTGNSEVSCRPLVIRVKRRLKCQTSENGDESRLQVSVSVAEGNRLVISTFEQRDSFAELRLLRDVFLAAIGADEPKIEASFCEAIRIAKEQKWVR